MTLEQLPGGIKITRRWSLTPLVILAGFVGLILLGLGSGILLVDFASEAVLGLVLAIPGALTVYYALAHFTNTTRILATPETITVRRGPLPWGGSRDLATRDVSNLFYLEQVNYDGRNRSTYSYPVGARLKSGDEILLETCDDLASASFVCRTINDSLK